MSLTPAYYFKGKTNCMDCGKEMGINDRGIYYNVSAKAAQDLMFCVPCAWKVTHAIVMDLVKLKDDEPSYYPVMSAHNGGRLFGEAYQEVSKIINEWADINDSISGVTKHALRKQTKTL